MRCHRCGADERWSGPNTRGVVQQWYRIMEHTARGWRCADRHACSNRRSALDAAANATLF